MSGRSRLEAARWAERLADGADGRALARFAGWCGEPANAEAYRRTAEARRLAAAVADHPELTLLREQARGRAAMTRGAAPRWMAAAAALAALAMPAAFRFGAGTAPVEAPRAAPAALHRTGVGERLALRLPDGSRVTLDTASRLRVAFTGVERRLSLEQGQALFDVASDPARPFIVAAGGREVTARGTSFDIRLDSNGMRVALVEGRVTVGSRGAAPVAMKPDEILVARGPVVKVRRDPAAVAALSSWSEGLLVFQDRPLFEAVAEMNRYVYRPVLIGDAAAGRVRISGSFRTGEVGPFLDALQIGFPVKAVRRGDGSVVVTSRR